MPKSDYYKYYAVGVVPCNAKKKHQLLQRISCDHKIVYDIRHLFFQQTAVVRLHSRKHCASCCVRNCFGNISGPNFMKEIYVCA